MAERAKPAEFSDVILDPIAHKQYLKGKFLGKGGLARCYELTDMDTNQISAGKIVAKTMLTKLQKDKMTQEIAIHRSLSHKHVVGFQGFFEDSENEYVLLELCRRRSLMELHKRRRAISEPEARYFCYQIVDACKYLHDTRVIHRDLKLGNLFINDEMEVKIGDFGLATKLDFDGERINKLCYIPNYIAPEMLGKEGHSYEVDIWAIGCILYTLLVGKPPFETTTSLKDAYMRIKMIEYPSRISQSAKHIVSRLLAADPTQRPTIHEILQFDFFTQGYMPVRLPTSCLTMAPKFSTQQLQVTSARKALGDANARADVLMSPKDQARKDILAAPLRQLNAVPENQMVPTPSGAGETAARPDGDVPSDYFLNDLYRQLSQLTDRRPIDRQKIQEDEAEDPASTPVFWISNWVDYSKKYGLGYQLCDNSVGVLFRDSSKLVLDGAGEQVQYIEKDNRESYYTIHNYPPEQNKKITLLKYFRNYMNEHLLKARPNMAPREGDELARLPCLRTWFTTRWAIVLYLSNGTLQVNFFQDHTKVMLCPLMQAVTFIDENREFKVYRFSLLEQFGCSKDLFPRLRYAREMVERLLTSSTSSRPGALSTAKSAVGACTSRERWGGATSASKAPAITISTPK